MTEQIRDEITSAMFLPLYSLLKEPQNLFYVAAHRGFHQIENKVCVRRYGCSNLRASRRSHVEW